MVRSLCGRRLRHSFSILLALAAATAIAQTEDAAVDVAVEFARGKWNPDGWQIVKGPRCEYCHGFTQRDGWIENECPDVSPEEVHRKHSDAVYSGMVMKRQFRSGATVSSTMGWDYRMAPLIVIAPELGRSRDGKHLELHDHWEIVIYDRGINVWRHFWNAEKGPSHIKAASLKLEEPHLFRANVRHELKVTLSRNRKGHMEMTCSCGPYTLQYVDKDLPETFYAGILGCEGRNFFYDFKVTHKRR